ncbi:hypothetical protein C9R18_26660, partial [Salmonella enterica subsp. enterica serovar Enteritidis]|nr:hypothetical protein [Salmonella enterica subsp. enterica serovar Enteritidis]
MFTVCSLFVQSLFFSPGLNPIEKGPPLRRQPRRFASRSSGSSDDNEVRHRQGGMVLENGDLDGGAGAATVGVIVNDAVILVVDNVVVRIGSCSPKAEIGGAQRPHIESGENTIIKLDYV